MARIPLPFARQFGARSDLYVSSEELINWWAHKTEVRGKESFVLMQRPGLVNIETIDVGPHRGSLVHDGVMYVVSNSGVYSVNTSETITLIGSLNTFAGRVGMSSNGTELIIVDGADGWIYDSLAVTYTQITDVDFVDAEQVVFFHGRFVVIKPSTGEFYISGLYDGTTWAALDYANAEVDPDDLIALIVSHEQLWLLGEVTTQAYLDTGNPLFPYESQPGGTIEWGIAAKWSVAKGDNTVIWLAKTSAGQANVVKATGFSPQVISSAALEEAMADYDILDDAYAFVMKPNERSLFYVLTFPSENVTWVYDFTTDLWHQWSSYGVGRFNAATHCYFNNRHYIGSATDGALSRLDAGVYADNSDPLVRKATTQSYSENQNMVFWKNLEILFEAGNGLAIGQGSDPQAMLRWSDDSGHTYGNSIWRSIGKIGEYGVRAVWNKLGRSRNRVYELTMTDPVRSTVVGVFAEITSASVTK